MPFVARLQLHEGVVQQSPAVGPCQLSEQVARLVRLSEYVSVALQYLPEGLCHIFIKLSNMNVKLILDESLIFLNVSYFKPVILFPFSCARQPASSHHKPIQLWADSGCLNIIDVAY